TGNGIRWRRHSGAPWRDIPERYGPWQRISGRFRRWRRDGTWAKVLTHLLEDLERRGRLGRTLWLVDATIIRASRAAGGAEKKSPRGAPPGRGGGGGKPKSPRGSARALRARAPPPRGAHGPPPRPPARPLTQHPAP